MRTGTHCIQASFRIAAGCALLAALGLFAGSAAAESSGYEEKSERTLPVGEVQRVVLRNHRGDISVRGEEGRTDIRLEIIKRVLDEESGDSEQLIRMMGVEVTQSDDELRIRADYPREEDGKGIISMLFKRDPRMEMEFIVVVPRGMPLVLSTASGDIAVKELTGAIEVTAASGDVKAVDLGGSLEVTVASGNVDIQNVRGNMSINSASGDVRGREVGGDVSVYTSSGNIRLADIGGDLVIKSAAGDCHVDGVRDVSYSGMSGTVRLFGVSGAVKANVATGDLELKLAPMQEQDYFVRSSTGNIDLEILEAMPGGYILKAGTTTGDINADLAIKISRIGKNHISGVVREGKGKIVLETTSGNITIAERER